VGADEKQYINLLAKEVLPVSQQSKSDVIIDVDYLTKEDIIFIHHAVMTTYDEPENGGVMHPDRLEVAVERPQSVVFGEEVHKTLWQKAGALVQTLVNDHVFYNGNKRTAFACLMHFLDRNGYYVAVNPAIAEEFMVAIATDKNYKGDKGAKNIGAMIEALVKSHL
jgi:death on curing protein